MHRSHSVNPDFVSSVERFTVTMTNGVKLPVPTNKFNEVRDALINFQNIVR
ncbi:MAG: hypothetical protein ACI4IQ_07315 [Eubacterium sp.]